MMIQLLFPNFTREHPRLTRVLEYSATITAAFVVGTVIATWELICRGDRCPSVELLGRYLPSQTAKVYAADGRFVAEIGLERRTLVPLQTIPPIVRNAFVSVEDKRFYRHHGIDILRIPGSAIRNLQAGSFAQGFSTITMQLARNVFPEHLSREKSLVRKIKEAHVALDIERHFSKDRILELYLNQINLGSGAYGVETASQRYFGKSVKQVNIAEAATLAALPKAPGRYNPRRYPDRAISRRNTIIELMRRNGELSNATASLAKAYPLQLARRIDSGDIAPYFIDWVRQQLHDRFGDKMFEEGLKVYTTLDLDMQATAERTLENQMRAIEGGRYGSFRYLTYEQYIARGSRDYGGDDEAPYLQGAFIAMDPRDGSVRAMIGGRDYDDSKFNRATQALRQPGSTFKPIVYSTAIQSGRPPSMLIDDSPISVPQVDGTDWTPQNYDMKFEGPMTMRRGLYESRNLIAIRLGMELGEQTVVQEARRFGITTPIPPYPSIHIGSAEVYPIELVSAYTTFANLGTRTKPNAIVRVEDQKGNVLWEPQPESESVLSPAEAWIMVSMMKDVVQRGTAAASVWGAGFHVPSAGKTGTTNDGADVWFVGYTADLVAGVWMGFDKPKKIMPNAQGGRLAAPAYTTFMTELYRRKPEPPDWPMPSSIVTRQVDASSGLLASDQCPESVYTEYFLPGTEPSQYCAPTNPFALPVDTLSDPRPDTPRVMLPARGAVPASLPRGKLPTKSTKDSANPFKIP